MEHKFEVGSLSELPNFAMNLVKLFGNQRIILFKGEMGAGKTTLIKYVCQALGIEDPVNSPTFSIVNEYVMPDGEPLYHFDLYRIENTKELFELGFEEYFYSGYFCLIEWPENAGSLIPDDHMVVEIRVEDGKRLIMVR